MFSRKNSTLLGVFIFAALMTLNFFNCQLTEADPVEYTIILDWDSPGDDGNVGTATSYDIRYHYESITLSNWDEATIITEGIPVPEIAGTPQFAIVTFMAESESYVYFAIVTSDEAGNKSIISNVAEYLTNDIIVPGEITNLSVRSE